MLKIATSQAKHHIMPPFEQNLLGYYVQIVVMDKIQSNDKLYNIGLVLDLF